MSSVCGAARAEGYSSTVQPAKQPILEYCRGARTALSSPDPHNETRCESPNMANSPNMVAVVLFNRRSINDLSFGPRSAISQGGNCEDNAESRGGGGRV